ncbi:MAG: AMP-binding protein [Alphaproteobacteria bacterium]
MTAVPPWAPPFAIREEVHHGRRVRCFGDRPRNLHALLDQAVRRAPDREAVVDGAARERWADLDLHAGALAGGLARLGIGAGDRIAIQLDNGRPFLRALWACARLGAIAVPLGTRLQAPEVAHALADSGAAAIVVDPPRAVRLPPAAATPALRHRIVAGPAGDGLIALDDLVGPAPSVAAVGEDDPAVILYTSGTTGRPKGAVLTGLGIVHSAMHYQACLDLHEGERTLLAVPASHVTGLVALIATTARVAGTLVLMADYRTPAFLDLAARERIGFTVLVPAMLNLCLREPGFAATDLSAWRVCGYGGAPMPEATIAGIAAGLPHLRLANLYGATETTSPTTVMPEGGTALHPDSVGRVVPLGDLRIVDEDGRERPTGEVGELWIAGPMVVPRYWQNPAASAAAFEGGWWKSGDLGTIDADGFVRVLDRKKDMVNRGGFKVYGVEVENVLAELPGVVESAVIGRPCPVLGERVHAFVRAADPAIDLAAIRAFCALRLADYKVPETLTLIDGPLPRNANGKVMKAELRHRLAEEGT